MRAQAEALNLADRGTRASGPFTIACLYVAFELTALQLEVPFLQYLRLGLVLTAANAVGLACAALSGRVEIGASSVRLAILFWVLGALHIPYAFNNMAAYGVTLTLLPYLTGCVAILAFTKTTSQLGTLIHVWLFSHVYQALYATLLRGGRGPGGYFGDENDLAVTLSMAVPVAYFLFIHRHGRAKPLYAACVVILLTGIVATFSRGGFIGLMAGAGYIVWRSGRSIGSHVKILIVAAGLLLFAPATYWTEMGTIGAGVDNRTGEHRVYLWKVALRMFGDNALWGVGPGSFKFAAPVYEPPGGFHGQNQGLRALHSTPLTVVAEFGVPGVVLFASLIGAHVRSLSRVARGQPRERGGALPSLDERGVGADSPEFLRSAARGFGGSLVCFLVGSVFVSMLYYPQFWIATAIIAVIGRLGTGASRP